MSRVARHVDLSLPGGRVRIRLARHDDTDALEAGFAHLSEDSRYTRFFTAMPKLSGALLGQLTEIDGVDRVAIAAFDPDRASEVGEDDDGYGIGVGRFIRPTPGGDVAELAVAVIDEYHGRGLGRILMASIVVAAQQRGVARLQAYVLTTNTAMLTMLARLGAVDHDVDDWGHGVRLLEFDVASTLAHPFFDEALITRLRWVLDPLAADTTEAPA
jgi:GNAT superfamily N-acetyltransferase